MYVLRCNKHFSKTAAYREEFEGGTERRTAAYNITYVRIRVPDRRTNYL
nr:MULTISPECIES: palindromic element RPE1 domain-containing protein [spotted fever group]